MKCEWKSLLTFLPLWMREKVDKLGSKNLLELRLRINAPPELVLLEESLFLERMIRREDIDFVINLATKYSPWSSETIGEGYITIPGGHRIGICGTMIPSQNINKGFRSITSLCIRISRDFPGIAKNMVLGGSVLIIGRPGSGKTTLLRDLIRQIAANNRNRVVVIDERHEVFPFFGGQFCYDLGTRIDVISGCSKEVGIELVIRSMTPTVIAVDEITAESDTKTLINAIGCGITLLATAHASVIEDLSTRPVYQTLLNNKVFQSIVILHEDRTWHLEKAPK